MAAFLRKELIVAVAFALLGASSILAEDLEVEHPEPGVVILRAKSCEALKAHLEALAQWKMSRGEMPPPILLDCAKEKTTSADIAQFIPSSVRKIYGQFPLCEGQNCSSAALVDANILKYPRYVTSFEWRYYLDTLCKSRINGPPQAGDLAAIRERTGPDSFAEIHGFTVIDPELACSKNGMDLFSACFLQSHSDVLTRNGVNIHEQNCINPTQIPPKNCSRFVNYFSCTHVSPALPQDITLLEQELYESVAIDAELDVSQMGSRIKDIKGDRLSQIIRQSLWKQLGYVRDYKSLSDVGKAVRRGEVQRLQTLLDQGADPDPHGEAVLYEAAARGKLEIVKLLVEKHEELRRPKSKIESSLALNMAAMGGYLNIVDFLLSKQISMETKDKYGNTPLSGAALFGWEKVMRLLLKSGAAIESRNKTGLTALEIAARRGYLSAVTLLLDKGAAIDSQDQNGWTALMWALSRIHFPVAQELLKRWTQVNIRNKLGQTALHFAAVSGNVDVVRAILARGATAENSDSFGETALDAAASKGDVQIVRVIVAARPSNVDKSAALRIAAWKGHLPVVKLLFTLGGKKDSQNAEGFTALNLAAGEGATDVVRALIQARASLEIPAKNGFTPLGSAVFRGQVDAVRELINSGANPLVRALDGSSVLDLARNPLNQDALRRIEILDMIQHYVERYVSRE